MCRTCSQGLKAPEDPGQKQLADHGIVETLPDPEALPFPPLSSCCVGLSGASPSKTNRMAKGEHSPADGLITEARFTYLILLLKTNQINKQNQKIEYYNHPHKN